MSHCCHIWYNDTQYAMLQAQALAEGRTVNAIVKGSAMQYVIQYKVKLAPKLDYVKHVPQKIKPI